MTTGMLESRQLRCFLGVAEALHFGRAADKLGIAQSALSRHVLELERSLGVRLLNRGRRAAVSLTEPGRAFFADALVGSRQLERARQAAHGATRGETGRIAVGYVASAALSGVLPAVLAAFRARQPLVRIELGPMETPRQLAALSDGLIDVALLRSRREYPSDVKAVVVHREPMLIAMAADHALARRRVDIGALADQTFIIPQFDENTGFAEHVAELASSGGFQPKNIVHVRDFLTAVTLAGAGYGVVPVPRCMLAINLRNVTFKRIQGYAGTAELAVAHHRHRLSAAAQRLVQVALRLGGGPAGTRAGSPAAPAPKRSPAGRTG